MSLNTVMDNSLSAMYAAQAGLSTTSHNIANADVRGYSRQTNLLGARRPLMFSHGAIGQGVDVLSVRRAHDGFLLKSLRSQTARQASYESMDSGLYEVENILGSVQNDHLGEAINSFFLSWHELATPPVDPALKALVVQKAQSLVTDMHTTAGSLDDLARNIGAQVEEEIDRMNRLLQQVGEMNGQIMAAETGGQPANDLRDQRDQLVNEISRIAAVAVEERDDGSVDLILNGRTVVTRSSVQEFTTNLSETENGYRIEVVTDGNYHHVELPEGSLQGLLSSRDQVVDDVRGRLDELAQTIISRSTNCTSRGRPARATACCSSRATTCTPSRSTRCW